MKIRRVAFKFSSSTSITWEKQINKLGRYSSCIGQSGMLDVIIVNANDNDGLFWLILHRKLFVMTDWSYKEEKMLEISVI